jgi:hypothetical protein
MGQKYLISVASSFDLYGYGGKDLQHIHFYRLTGLSLAGGVGRTN